MMTLILGFLLVASTALGREQQELLVRAFSAAAESDAGDGSGFVAADLASAAADLSSNRNSSSSSSSYASDLKRKCERYRDQCYDGDYSSWREEGASYYARANDLDSQCPSRATNAHGSYTSRGNCYFKFHAIPNEGKVAANKMSVACSNDNVVVDDEGGSDASHEDDDDPIRHPVTSWPDACVGDFSRCYRLGHDEDKILKFICTKRLEVPEGATHLSVDCTSDKVTLREMLERGELKENSMMDPVLRGQEKERRDHRAFVATMSVALCAFVAVCLLLVHRYAFQPYLKALKRSRSDPELFCLSSRQASLSRP